MRYICSPALQGNAGLQIVIRNSQFVIQVWLAADMFVPNVKAGVSWKMEATATGALLLKAEQWLHQKRQKHLPLKGL
jgi:hypothetical protein